MRAMYTKASPNTVNLIDQFGFSLYHDGTRNLKSTVHMQSVGPTGSIWGHLRMPLHIQLSRQAVDKHSVVTMVTQCFSDNCWQAHYTVYGEAVLRTHCFISPEVQRPCWPQAHHTLLHLPTAVWPCIQGHGMSTHLVIAILEVVVKEPPSKGIKLTVLFSIHEGNQFALKEDMQEEQVNKKTEVCSYWALYIETLSSVRILRDWALCTYAYRLPYHSERNVQVCVCLCMTMCACVCLCMTMCKCVCVCA